MKQLKIFITSLMVFTATVLYTSCTKEIPQVAPIQTNFSTSANVQVFNATVKATRNYVYVDAVPVSGIALAFGGVFPGTAYSFKVNAGSPNFLIKDTLPTTTQTQIAFTYAMEAGKSYTIFTYDTITSAKQITVENKIVIPTDTSCMLRFANFIYNTTPVANVDVYSYRRGTATPVFTNIATTQVTDFIPYASGITDTLYVYATGTTSPLLVKALVPSLVPTRSYTSVFNGGYKTTGTAKAISTFATY